jgi:radical SAM superfamily enzyme YgiQ (UPF0313 family)
MRLLLANPPCRLPLPDGRERFFVRAGCRWPYSVVKRPAQRPTYTPFPFFLAYAAAVLRDEGFGVDVDDAVTRNDTEAEFVARTRATRPDLVVYETATPTARVDLALAGRLHRLGTRVCLVGPHATTFGRELLARHEDVDFVVAGEYEAGVVALCAALDGRPLSRGAGLGVTAAAGRGGPPDLADVPGLVYRDADGEVRANPPAVIPELDRLPFPARDLFPRGDAPDPDAYWDGFCQLRPALQLHASRGCPFRCSFCLWTQVIYQAGNYRTFSPGRVVDEMVAARDRFGAREVYFDDDTFTGKRAQVEAICAEIVRRGLAVPWSCMADAVVTDAELVDTMAAAGCIGLKFGVESASPEVLRRVGKPAALLDHVDALAARLGHHGIKSHATFTFGLPGESPASMAATFALACRLDVDMVQFSISTPFPGTRYHEEAERSGWLRADAGGDDFDGAQRAAVELPGLPARELEAYARSAHGRWLLRKARDPRWVARQAHLLGRVVRGQGLRGITEKLGRAAEVLGRAATEAPGLALAALVGRDDGRAGAGR